MQMFGETCLANSYTLSLYHLNKGGVMLPEKQNKAFTEFYNSAKNNDILDSKTTLMIHMAASMAVGCYP